MSFIDRSLQYSYSTTKDMAKIHKRSEASEGGEPCVCDSPRSNIISNSTSSVLPEPRAQKKELVLLPPLLPEPQLGPTHSKLKNPFFFLGTNVAYAKVRIHVKMHSYESLLFRITQKG